MVFLNTLAFVLRKLNFYSNKPQISVIKNIKNMENQRITPAQTALNFGIILGAYNIIVGIMLYFLNMHYQNDQTVGIINIVFTVIIIMVGIIQYKKANEGFLSLTEALKIGLGVAVISGVLGIIYYFILTGILDPETLDKSLEFQKQKMLSSDPEMSVESANKFVEMQRKFSSPLIISAFAIVGSLFIGFVISLIGGLIVKKSRPE